MTLKLIFDEAKIAGLVLAKVGNPSRDEPLQTSKKVLRVEEDDQALLTGIFLRPFRGLGMPGQHFHHHSSLEKHEINGCAATIFGQDDGLLEKGCEIAQRLYSKSNHPNIKSGDLCMALVQGIEVEGKKKSALCLLKSESVSPFLSIRDRDGDLQLLTEHGINPEKIDKGCLILDHMEDEGYYVLTFDRASSESRFWVRDFLGVVPIPDAGLMTKKVAELAMSAVSCNRAAATSAEESAPWAVNAPAKEALAYFDGRKKFSMQEFEEKALQTPEARKRFAEERRKLEEEEGVKVDESFAISKRDVAKARKGMKSRMQLDTGVEIRLRPKVVDKPERVLEVGYDSEKEMKFIKVYYNKDLAG